MKPSIGRVVHYQAFGTPGGEFKSQPRAAIVVDVHESVIDGYKNRSEILGSFTEVTLCVLNPSGIFFNKVKQAPRTIDGEEIPTPGCWNWPPRVDA